MSKRPRGTNSPAESDSWRPWSALGFVESENWILHATVVGWRVSNSIGLSMPRALWGRWRLWKTSRQSKMALASSRRVRQRRRSSSSTCMRDQNDTGHGVVVAGADATHGGHQPRRLGPLAERPGGELHPWSEWIRVPAAGRRDSIAIPRALVTS